MGFCYQKNTKDLSAVKCGRKDFWRSIRLSSTAWIINTRRDILRSVEENDEESKQRWLQHTDFKKFMLRTIRDLKTKTAKDRWKSKSDDKKLLAWADDLKKTLTAFTFCCYEFDVVNVKTKDGKQKKECRRQLKGCHVNGLVMLDIDHTDNPLEIWEKLQQNEELMKRVVLVHITSSGRGIRIIFTANIEDGNLADNIIVFAAALGYKADSSCIDATRNSFAPKEDEIIFINEERLFNYYDEEFDKKYTPMYRERKTQPINHEFPTAVKGTDSTDLHGLNNSAVENKSSDNPCNPCQEIKWRGYDVQSIIDQRYADKLPCADDSNRHKESLKLATDLLLMLDGDKQTVQKVVEAQSWVQEIIDERNENVTQTVDSAADCVAQKEKKYASSLPSKAMLEAIQGFTGKTYQEITKGTKASPAALADDDMA